MTSKYGPHAAGVQACVAALLGASADDWRTLVAVGDQIPHEESRRLIDAVHVGSASREAALDKLQRSLTSDPDVRSRWAECGGIRFATMARVLSTMTVHAVALRDALSDEDFLAATAPARAAGIDCEAFSRMGEIA